MAERTLLAVGLFGLVIVAGYVTRMLIARRQAQIVGQAVAATQATILYFSGPRCTTCRTLQAPALEQLHAEVGDAVEIQHLDATVAVDEAATYKVMTVPTTVVVREGHVVAINNGFAPATTLRRQLGLQAA